WHRHGTRSGRAFRRGPKGGQGNRSRDLEQTPSDRSHWRFHSANWAIFALGRATGSQATRSSVAKRRIIQMRPLAIAGLVLMGLGIGGLVLGRLYYTTHAARLGAC